MIVRKTTWFRFHVLTDIVAKYLTPLDDMLFKLDHSEFVHEIARCLPAEEDLGGETEANDLAQQSVDRLWEATIIREDSAIVGDLASAITSFREGRLDNDYESAIADACQNASNQGYLI